MRFRLANLAGSAFSLACWLAIARLAWPNPTLDLIFAAILGFASCWPICRITKPHISTP